MFGSYPAICYIRPIIRSASSTYMMSQCDWYQPRSHFAREDTEHGQEAGSRVRDGEAEYQIRGNTICVLGRKRRHPVQPAQDSAIRKGLNDPDL